MGAYVWPADAVTGAPSYTGRKLRQLLGGLLIGKTASRPLGGRSGVWPGTSTTTVTISAGNWQVGAHAGALDLETAAEAGPYFYSSDDAPFVGTAVTAADGTNSRIDIVYVQLSDPAEGDGTTTPGVAFGYLAGSPGTGVPPTTPARSMVLAWLNVPNTGGGGVGSATVTWKAPLTVAAGGVIPVSSGSMWPTSPHDGQMLLRTDLSPRILIAWDATAAQWQTLGGKPTQPKVSARFYRSAAKTLAASGRTDLALDATSFDYNTSTLLSGGVVTVPETGLYHVSWRVAAGLGNNPQDFMSLIATPSFAAELSYGSRVTVRGGTGGDLLASVGSDLLPLAAGGQIILAGRNGGGNTLTATVGAFETWLAIRKVQ
jgi:hypothetical protein